MTLRALIVALALAACGRLDFAPRDDANAGGPVQPRSQLVLGQDPGELLADFPLLVVLDDQRAARDLMAPDGSDLRFFDTNGNVLADEIEQLGAPGGLPMVIWVRVPAIDGPSTTLTIDYGHGTPPPASSLSVWSDTYRGVWHLADLTDATTNHHDGSWLGGAMQSAAGIAGPTLAFEGALDDAIAIPDSADLSFTTALTVSGWIDVTAFDAASGYTCIASRQNGSSTDDDFWIGVDNPTAFADSVISVPAGTQIGTPDQVVGVASWSDIAMTYDGATERLYVAGVQVAMTSATGDVRHGAHALLLGADHNSATGLADADFIDGHIDEVRIESIARTAAWLRYQDASVRDELISYGPVTR